MDDIAEQNQPAAKTAETKFRENPHTADEAAVGNALASRAGAYLIDAIESITAGFALFDAEDRLVLCNNRYRDVHPTVAKFAVPGAKFEDMVRGYAKAGLFGGTKKDVNAIVKKRLSYHLNTPSSHEHQLTDGRWVEIRESKTHDGGTVLIWTNISDRKRSERMQKGRNKVLEELATGASLEDVLALLITNAEEINPDMLGSVLLLDGDGKRLCTGAAPNLPDFYNQAVDGIKIGPKAGSCGAATYTGETVIAEDVMTHPNWKNFKDVAAKAKLRACWSQPILSASGKVLGTFAMYYREPRKPTSQDLDLIQDAARVAGIAIEHKRMEQALRDGDDRLRGAVNSLKEGFALFDANDKLVAFNDTFKQIRPAAEKIFEKGGTFEDLLRLNVKDGAIEEAIGREKDFIRERLKEHQTPHSAIVRRAPDGKWYLLEEARTPEGGIAQSFTDVTELKNANEALRLSEERFRDFSESASDWFWEMDENLRFTYFSDRFSEISGVKNENLVGKTRQESGLDPNDEEIRRNIADLEAHRPFRDFVHRRTKANGDVAYMSTTGKPIFDENGNFKGYRGTGKDITDNLHAEEEKRLALVQAEEANQAKSEFLATISHELRTPLNAILGFAEILSHQYLGPIGQEKYVEYADDIHASGEYLLDLVNDVLDISTIEAGKRSLVMETIPVREAIEECTKTVTGHSEKNGIKLSTRLPKNLPPLYADRRAVKQILLNIISNAIKFTPKGGRVSVSAKAVNGYSIIRVKDTGIGIPEEKIPSLKDPFERGDVDPYITQGGAGLGLAITHSLVMLHDGKLDIQSTPGKGTTVSVILPNSKS